MHQFMAFSILYVVSSSLIGQKQLTLVGFRAKKEQKGQAALGQNGGKDKAFSRSKKVSTLKISDFWGRSKNIYSLSYKYPMSRRRRRNEGVAQGRRAGTRKSLCPDRDRDRGRSFANQGGQTFYLSQSSQENKCWKRHIFVKYWNNMHGFWQLQHLNWI